MKMGDFFDKFDCFFSNYSKITMLVEDCKCSRRDYNITTNEAVHYREMWWRNLEIEYFSFDYDNVLYIVAINENDEV